MIGLTGWVCFILAVWRWGRMHARRRWDTFGVLLEVLSSDDSSGMGWMGRRQAKMTLARFLIACVI